MLQLIFSNHLVFGIISIWALWLMSIVISLALFMFITDEMADYFDDKLKARSIKFTSEELYCFTMTAIIITSLLPVVNLIAAWRLVVRFFVSKELWE